MVGSILDKLGVGENIKVKLAKIDVSKLTQADYVYVQALRAVTDMELQKELGFGQFSLGVEETMDLIEK